MSELFNGVHSLAQLRTAMRNCEQTKNLSVLEHGLQVAKYFEDLRQHILFGKPLAFEWRLPDWIYSRELWERVLPISIVRQYHWFHDCGKPFCRTVDEDGKVHFPDHANVSAALWRHIGGDEQIARLIEHDMDIHLLSASGLESFSMMPEAATLLLTGLAEIHANASMFGGIDSVSFKIKFKQINKRGKAFVSMIQDEKVAVNA